MKMPIRTLVFVALATFAVSCTKTPPVVNPPAPGVLTPAQVTEIQKGLDSVQAIAELVSVAYPQVVTAKDVQVINKFHDAATTTLTAAASGWKTTLDTALDQVIANLSANAKLKLTPYFNVVRAAVDNFVPGLP
jgi:hypothetical protein